MTSTVAVPTPGSMLEKIQYAERLATASLLPRAYQRNPANLLLAFELADALGISRLHAITSVHVIDGKPSASADLIASLARRAGHKLRVSGDDTYAVAQLIRADDADFTYEARWDLEKAKQAGLLGKGTWKQYPGALLRSRAITEVVRMGASDALYGVVHTPEELGAPVDVDGTPIGSAAPPAAALTTAAPAPSTDWVALATDATTADEVRALYDQARAAGELTEQVRAAIVAVGSRLAAVETGGDEATPEDGSPSSEDDVVVQEVPADAAEWPDVAGVDDDRAGS